MGVFDKIAFWRYIEENFAVMKKQYATPEGFIGNLVQTEEEFRELNGHAIMIYPSMEEVLHELENGKADEFFEDKHTPFATWLIPKGGTLDTFKGGYQEYWQIEKTAKNSFSVEKVSIEIVLATISKKYIIPFRYNFSKKTESEVTASEKDGQIVYEEN